MGAVMNLFDAEERMREASYSRVLPVRTWPARCPRCLRGLRTSKLLSRPPGRTDGPLVCGTCQKWELKWSRIEEARQEAREHAQKLRASMDAHPAGKGS